MKYEAKFEFEAGSPEEAAAIVTRMFYLGEVDADKVKVVEATENGGTVFQYPFTQKLIRGLSEGGIGRAEPAAG